MHHLTNYDGFELGYVTGRAVRLDPGKPDYFAVVGYHYPSWHRSTLQIFDASGRLVYEEVLPENANSLTVISGPLSSPEALLVGGEKTIWRY